MRKIIFFALSLVLGFNGCVSNDTEREIIISVESITVNQPTLAITMGDPAVTLTATVLPTNATNRNVVWSSSNTAIATVDNNGNVAAVSVGAASIIATAADGGKTAISNVTVNPANIAVTGVNLNKSEATLTVGGTVTLIATVIPESATNQRVTWNSGNSTVATVDAYGVVTAHSIGTAAIVASTVDGGKTAICNITVSATTVSVTGVSLNSNTLTLTIGASETLIATVAPDNATNRNVAWTSNNHAVATLDTNGRVTAHSAGTATITVTTADGNHTAICTVTVSASAVSVTGVSLNRSTLGLIVGASETLIATIAPTNATNQNIVWSSNNPSVATVDANGRVTAVAGTRNVTVGTATITATTEDGNHTATCIVTVYAPTISVTGVSLNSSTLTLAIGASETLIATITPDNATNQNVVWTSDNHGVATVDNNGRVTAHSAGTAVITTTTADGGITATCTVIVNAPTIPVTGVSLNNTTLGLVIGASETLIATIAPVYATNQNVTWRTNNPAVATVDNNGIVTARSVGMATITVTTADGGKTANSLITAAHSLGIGAPTPTTDPGVMINGIRWATRNVDTPGRIVYSPRDAGMFFQWNRPVIGWTAGWTGSGAATTTWIRANDPCPPGWRLPTDAELSSLSSVGNTWTTNWLGAGGFGRVFGTAPNQLFLPAAGVLSAHWGDFTNYRTQGFYWSSTSYGEHSGRHLQISSGFSNVIHISRGHGASVRCVSE